MIERLPGCGAASFKTKKMIEQIKQELIGYLKMIETFDKDSSQDGNALHSYLIQLTNIGARANYLRAEYQREFRMNKKKAYQTLTASSHSQQQYFAPSLAKDFVDSCCYESGYMVDLAERTAAQAVHTIDAVRTIISSLKSERQFAGYNA